MGTRYSTADDTARLDAPDGLGDLLFGRFSDAEIDSIKAVRDLREWGRE